MFRKKHTIKSKNVVGGKEQKQLREQALALYGITEAVWAPLLLLEQPEGDNNNSSATAEEIVGGIADAFFPKKSQCVQLKWIYGGATTATSEIIVVNDVPLLVIVDRVTEFDTASQLLRGVSTTTAAICTPTIFGFLRLRQCVSELICTKRPALRAAWERKQWISPVTPHTFAVPGVDAIMPMLTTTISTEVPPRGIVVWVNENTSTFLFRGAHLMGGGVLCVTQHHPPSSSHPASSGSSSCKPPAPLEVGDVANICVVNNPIPVAVGLLTPALVKAFNRPNPATISLRAPHYPESVHATYLSQMSPSVDGPAVFVVSSLGDDLWSEHVDGYRVFCTAKSKLNKESPLVIPPSHKGEGDASAPTPMGFDNFDLLGVRTAQQEQKRALAAAAAAAAASDENNNSGDAVVDGVNPAEEGTTELDTVDEALEEEEEQGTEVDDVEADDIEQEDVDWWSLFPTVESLLEFSLAEVVRAVKPSQLPLPTTSLVSLLPRCLPHGLPLLLDGRGDGAAATPGSEDPRVVLLTTRQIDWKKTLFKKALTLLTQFKGGDGLFDLKETKPGVHAVVKLYKSSLAMRDHKRKYQEFLNVVHYPALDDDDERVATEAAIRLGEEGGAGLRLRAELRIASLQFFFRPQHGLHADLLKLFMTGKWPQPDVEDSSTAAAVAAAPTVRPQDDDDDDDDEDDAARSATKGLATLKQLRDHLRAYASANGLLLTSAGQPPNVIINSLLRHLWPANKDDVPDTMPLLQLDALVERKFCPMHLIQYAVSDAASAAGVPVPRPRLRNGRPSMIFVHTEKRSGNKYVTIVKGLDAYGFALEVLALAWKHRFATSVAIVDPVVKENLVLKSGTKVAKLVQLQGRHNMEQHLTSEMGLPMSSISVRNTNK
ncbi:Hypothetical protein, putative [Bodo saltans]|uniref:SUI1 domain-containing protein n=1 Tax=Bodo saltans TaxID=75058 RepID=A0A0S4INV2_BODSA|nr:Hypothetical protein, putative [Bodo saltans]|eukprot:CUE83853.1 Hypothetical protein, putative [Bodo saltans]